MRIISRHVDIPVPLKDYISEKFKKLERFDDLIVDSEIILFKDGNSYFTEGVFFLKNEKKVIKAQGDNFFEAIDKLKDKSVRALRKFKDKIRSKARR